MSLMHWTTGRKWKGLYGLDGGSVMAVLLSAISFSRGGRPNIWEVTCEAIADGRGAQESLGSPVSGQYLKSAQGPSRLASYPEAGLPSIPVNMPWSHRA